MTMAPQQQELMQDIIGTLDELKGDSVVPRNIKTRVINIIDNLRGETEVSIKINKALSELDEIADDPNLQAYTRTQIWNIVSMLEKF